MGSSKCYECGIGHTNSKVGIAGDVSVLRVMVIVQLGSEGMCPYLGMLLSFEIQTG